MSKLSIDTTEQFSLIEEIWCKGSLDGKPVAVHAKVYRCNVGQWQGRFGAKAHLHPEHGGQVKLTAGILVGEKLVWGKTKKEAIDAALTQLESQDNLKV